MRHLPETHAQPVVPARAYVPPSQAGRLPRAALQPAGPYDASVSAFKYANKVAKKIGKKIF